MNFSFNKKHKKGTELIMSDILSCNVGLDLLLKTGKAVELNESDISGLASETIDFNGARLSCCHINELIQEARAGRKNSYAPYSHFNVGAAIFSENSRGTSKIFNGCNVENAAFGSTVCAERVAAFKAVSAGYRKFLAYAVVGDFDHSVPKKLRQAAQKEYIAPCGECRQVTNEFDAIPCAVILARDTGRVLMTTLEFMLPIGFGPKNMGVNALQYDRYNK